MMQLGINKEGKEVNAPNKFFAFITLFAIYGMFFLVVQTDIAIHLYQWFYFKPNRIPTIKRSEYVVIDRHKLKKLNFFQKLNCAYCGYTNGVIAWAKACANQTELYNCAIKHAHSIPNQEHQEEMGFYKYEDFL